MIRLNLYRIIRRYDIYENENVLSEIIDSSDKGDNEMEIRVFYLMNLSKKHFESFKESVSKQAQIIYNISTNKKESGDVRKSDQEHMIVARYGISKEQNIEVSGISMCMPLSKSLVPSKKLFKKCGRSVIGVGLTIRDKTSMVIWGCDLTKEGCGEFMTMERSLLKYLYEKNGKLDYKDVKTQQRVIDESPTMYKDNHWQDKLHTFLVGRFELGSTVCEKFPGSSVYFHRIGKNISYREAYDKYALLQRSEKTEDGELKRIGNMVGVYEGMIDRLKTKLRRNSIVDVQVDAATFVFHPQIANEERYGYVLKTQEGNGENGYDTPTSPMTDGNRSSGYQELPNQPQGGDSSPPVNAPQGRGTIPGRIAPQVGKAYTRPSSSSYRAREMKSSISSKIDFYYRE